MIGRVVPMLLVVGGLGAAKAPVENLVKSTLTGFELSQIAERMYTDWTLDCSPPPKSPDQLALYISENMRGKGGRDPSLDMWYEPYRVVGEEQLYTLYSTGANRSDEYCAGGGADLNQLAGALEGGGAGTDTGLAPGVDDICVDVNLPRCQSAYKRIR